MSGEGSPKSILPLPEDRAGWISALSGKIPDGLGKHLKRHLSSAINTRQPTDSSPMIQTVASILETRPSDVEINPNQRGDLLIAQFNLMQMLRSDYQVLIPVARESDRLISRAFAGVIDQDVTNLTGSEQKIYENTRNEVLVFLMDCKRNIYWCPIVIYPNGMIFLEAAARYIAKDLSTVDPDALRQADRNKYLATVIIKLGTQEDNVFSDRVAKALAQEGVMPGIASNVIAKPPEEIDLLSYPSDYSRENARENILLTLEELSRFSFTASSVAEFITHTKVYEAITSFLKTPNPSLYRPDTQIRTVREESKAMVLKMFQNLVKNEGSRSVIIPIIMNTKIIYALAFIFQRRQSLEDLLMHDAYYSEAFSKVRIMADDLFRLISPRDADQIIKGLSSVDLEF